MKKLFDWIHHLLNPHCPECEADREDEWQKKHTCQNCESLLLIIEKQRTDYQNLVEKVMRAPEQVDNRPEHEVQPQPITRFVPWHLRRQMMELEDKKKASELKKVEPAQPKQTTEELEQELLGEANAKS